jgi:hypothetical protein
VQNDTFVVSVDTLWASAYSNKAGVDLNDRRKEIRDKFKNYIVSVLRRDDSAKKAFFSLPSDFSDNKRRRSSASTDTEITKKARPLARCEERNIPSRIVVEPLHTVKRDLEELKLKLTSAEKKIKVQEETISHLRVSCYL